MKKQLLETKTIDLNINKAEELYLKSKIIEFNDFYKGKVPGLSNKFEYRLNKLKDSYEMEKIFKNFPLENSLYLPRREFRLRLLSGKIEVLKTIKLNLGGELPLPTTFDSKFIKLAVINNKIENNVERFYLTLFIDVDLERVKDFIKGDEPKDEEKERAINKIKTRSDNFQEKVLGIDMSFNYLFVTSSKFRCYWYKNMNYIKDLHKNPFAISKINESVDYISNNYDVVVIENLEKSVIDSFSNKECWELFIEKLKEALAMKKKQLVVANMFYPSSQLCNNCGYRYKELGLNERRWRCPECGEIHNRDLNAAKNLVSYYQNGANWYNNV